MSGTAVQEQTVQYPVVMKSTLGDWAGPAGAAAAAALLAWVSANNGAYGAASVVVMAVGAAAGLWALVVARKRTTITADAVERATLFGIRRLARDEVVGYRPQPANRYSSASRLLFPREHGRPMRVPDLAEGRRTWVGTLPDLDATARQAADRALEANPALGRTVEVRRARIAAIRHISTGLLVAGAGLSFACLFWPAEPHTLILAAAAAPLIGAAIALTLSRLGGRTLDGRRMPVETRWLVQPSVILLLTSVGLAIRIGQLQLIDPWSLAPAAVVVAIPLLAVIGWLDRDLIFDRSFLLPIMFAAAGVAYAAGTIAEVNVALDSSPGRAVATRITEMHVARHRRAPDTYVVTLAPWRGLDRTEETDVPPELYGRLHEGERMCVTQHRGALGFGWFTAAAC
jgi:hypothetical protein